MRSGPASPWKNRRTSLISAPGCGKGASARLRPVARPPMKLTPVSTPPRAPGSSHLAVFATVTASFGGTVAVPVAVTRSGPLGTQPWDCRRLGCLNSSILSGCQESFEERSVALEGVAQVVGGDVVAAVPLAL